MRITNAELANYESSKFDCRLIGELSEDKPIYDIIKRVIDIILCLIAFPPALIIMGIAGIFIKLESEGPVIYKQERLGKNGVKFNLYKLRSMRNDAEKNGAMWAQKSDPRITKVGKFIRKTRIDELPQLINIWRGDMVIVGPRPERGVFYKKFESEIPGFSKRLRVKPGLTGYAQVNGGYEMAPKEKLDLDMQYIRERSLLVDIKIIFRTIYIVFSGDGAR